MSNSSHLAPKARILVAEPISYPFDYWLLAGLDDVFLIGTYWEVQLIAPSPRTGEWVSADEFAEHFPKNTVLWKWVPATSPGIFSPLPRVWVFQGEKPEFLRANRKWAFKSNKPNLTLFEQSRQITWRFRHLPEGLLEITRNSHFTTQLYPKILDSFAKGERPEWKEFESQIEIPAYATGAEAIEPCGAKAWIGDNEVEFFDYDPETRKITVGIPKSKKPPPEKIVIEMSTQNLGVSMTGVMKAELVSVDTEMSEQFDILEMILDKKSSGFYDSVQEALEKRQLEIESFIRQVKGTDES